MVDPETLVNGSKKSSTEPTRIIRKPRPGGVRTLAEDGLPTLSPPVPARPTGSAAGSADGDVTQEELPAGRRRTNSLEAAASPLLGLLARVQCIRQPPDAAALLENTVESVKAFTARARARGADRERVFLAQYILCAALDDAVLITPWGGESVWLRQGLLPTFHGEELHGVKFFSILDRLKDEPERNRDLLELINICLALGFQGRYRGVPGGRDELEQIRTRLSRLIRAHRGDHETELSSRWKGLRSVRERWTSYMPIWVALALSALVLLGAYLGLRTSLSSKAGPLAAELSQFGDAAPFVYRGRVERVPPAPAAKHPSLRELLGPDLGAGDLRLGTAPGSSTVTVRARRLFAPASADLNPEYISLFGRIAVALEQVPGRIRVTGHTDSDPVRLGVDFSSNWDLSQARADAVAGLLRRGLSQPSRVRPVGLADTEPLVPNDTPEHKAINRRVEITLLEPRP